MISTKSAFVDDPANDNKSGGYELMLQPNGWARATFCVGNGGNEPKWVNTQLQAGEWAKLSMVIDGNKLICYKNGEKTVEETFSAPIAVGTGIIRKTKCSSVLKQNVLFYKTKRTSVNLFSYPNWHKKAPKKYVFFGAFYCSVFWLSHQKSLTLNKYIIFGFNAILIPLKRRYIIPPESWARHRLYSIMSVYVAL